MSNCQHIGIIVILTYHMVFGPNYDAGVEFLLCLDPVSSSYSKNAFEKWFLDSEASSSRKASLSSLVLNCAHAL